MQLGSRFGRRQAFDLRQRVTISGTLVHSTDKSYLIAGTKARAFVPRGLVSHSKENGTFTMPAWLARHRGFV
jgi:hypothetical protein